MQGGEEGATEPYKTYGEEANAADSGISGSFLIRRRQVQHQR